MNKLLNFLEEKCIPVFTKIASMRYLRVLRDGLAVTMPLVIVGSVFMLLANLPVPGYVDFINGIFGEGFNEKLLYPALATFDILTLVAVAAISYQVAKDRKVDGLSSALVSIAAFISLVPVFNIADAKMGEDLLNLGRVIQTNSYLSAGGLIVGIIVGIASAELYAFVVNKKWVIKMPDSVPPAVAQSFVAITPTAIILSICWVIKLIMEMTSFENIFNFINYFVAAPLSSVGLSFFVFFSTTLSIHLFWMVGIHGSRVTFGVMDSILLPAMEANRAAYENGDPIPNIVTKQFYDCFLNAGGLATAGLVLCLVLFAKSKQGKTLGKLAFAPTIFNIAEPVMFGFPVILNPIMLIPFIIAPLIIGSLTYFTMYIGLVSKPVGVAVPWTVPPILSGILATGGDWRAGVLQAVNLVISFLVYYPFFKLSDRRMAQEEHKLESQTVAEVN